MLESDLPAMPPNVHAVRHNNECFDWGTFGWVRSGPAGGSRACWSCHRAGGSRAGPSPPCHLASLPPPANRLPPQAINEHIVDTSRYQYIVFLNSSVRGPFLPTYWPVRSPRCWGQGWNSDVSRPSRRHSRGVRRGVTMRLSLAPCPLPQADKHWSKVLTERLSREVKLVGATISCEGANKGGVLSGEMRRNPHVQSYVVATDQVCWVGLRGRPGRRQREAGQAAQCSGPRPSCMLSAAPARLPPRTQTGLALLQQDGRVLKCYTDIHDAIW